MCEKRYSLIVFLDEKEIERSETVQVDIVPTKWIFCDDHNKLVCPFINESTKDKINLLHKLVRENKPADSSWNNYRVEVRGTADTYKEGLEKLKILRTQAYAFSTDNEQHILKKQDSIKKQCRLKGMAKKKIKNKSLEDVGTFDLSTDDEMGNSISSQILADSDDNSSSNTLSKKSTTSSETIQLEYTNSKKADIFKEKDFYGAVGIVLNNSRDWHGYREKRKLQNQEKLDKNQEENTENPTNSNEEML
ncbi:uncharacterized protein LOC123302385 [Chrysoperla carnea]|uniref:uncharacterized protein LOC123302385 n=1 Tax=Chrysoperla carnea TaxID=189513 RepID=UPI001D072E45|nr:uncharacterized protein LOC123302385 [Chrysoperla carnea]